MANITLTTKEGEQFTVSEEVANRFGTIKNLLIDVGRNTSTPIPLPEVAGNVFNKILEFANYHVENPVKVENDKFIFSDWDVSFFKMEVTILLPVVTASNYLDDKELLDMSVQAVADLIKDKTPEDIRKLFAIENDFTPEEEAVIRKENEWLEE